MSGTVPPVETTPHPVIVTSQTPLDVVNAALNDPVIMAVFKKYAGDPNGLIAALAGMLVATLVAHFGLQLSSDVVGTLSLVVAAAFGFGWQVLSRKFLTPATPVTQGTST